MSLSVPLLSSLIAVWTRSLNILHQHCNGSCRLMRPLCFHFGVEMHAARYHALATAVSEQSWS